MLPRRRLAWLCPRLILPAVRTCPLASHRYSNGYHFQSTYIVFIYSHDYIPADEGGVLYTRIIRWLNKIIETRHNLEIANIHIPLLLPYIESISIVFFLSVWTQDCQHPFFALVYVRLILSIFYSYPKILKEMVRKLIFFTDTRSTYQMTNRWGKNISIDQEYRYVEQECWHRCPRRRNRSV